MGFNKEKERLNMMLQSVIDINIYTEQNFQLLIEVYNEFRKIVLALYKKHTNIFGNIYNYQLKEIKDNKKKILSENAESSCQSAFIIYKDSIENALERAIDYITEYI